MKSSIIQRQNFLKYGMQIEEISHEARENRR